MATRSSARTTAREAFASAVSASYEPINDRGLIFDGSIGACECEDCRNNHGFTIPRSLVRAFAEGDVVVFAGAGISTENRNVMSHTLHEEVCFGLGLDAATTSFPDAMEKFSEQPNGRLRLIQRIVDRIAYVESFAELRQEAQKFHDELATMFWVDTVVTTNWDRFFEDRCDCQPFTLDVDMAFWESAKRKVLKIHGSIDNLSTIVATRDDYNKKLPALHTSLMGSRLKTLLSTKTIVFFGYSLRDDDFREIMEFVRTALGSFQRQNYIVTIDTSPSTLERFRGHGLIPITTDGAYFLRQIKAHLAKTSCANPDSVYEHAASILSEVEREHLRLYRKFNIVDDPEIVYCACYQDGLMHSLQRIVDSRPSGAYSDLHSVQAKLRTYDLWRSERLEGKRYEDVAYIDGYSNGLTLALVHKEMPDALPPLYYLFTRKPVEYDSIDEFQRKLRQARKAKTFHKGALKKQSQMSYVLILSAHEK